MMDDKKPLMMKEETCLGNVGLLVIIDRRRL
jgi:hypothetical protein